MGKASLRTRVPVATRQPRPSRNKSPLMQHQQWETVTFGKQASAPSSASSSKFTPRPALTARNGDPSFTKTGKVAVALQDDTEHFGAPQTIDASIKKAIIQARGAKKLTQKELAMQINVDAKIVQA